MLTVRFDRTNIRFQIQLKIPSRARESGLFAFLRCLRGRFSSVLCFRRPGLLIGALSFCTADLGETGTLAILRPVRGWRLAILF